MRARTVAVGLEAVEGGAASLGVLPDAAGNDYVGLKVTQGGATALELDKDGKLRQDLFRDAVHLSRNGYVVWGENTRAAVKALMK